MIIIASYSNITVTYTADGTQTVFSFPFDYLRKAFVYVEVNEETILTQGTDYSVSGKTVIFATAPASGTLLRIYRETDTTRLVSWADASVLKASDMTVQQVQELHILEEQEYWTKENTIVRNGHQWNARNFPIKNTGDPVDPKDATTKKYVDDELDTAIENLQLLADVVVDSDELQHITDQLNAIDDRADDAQDSADAAATSEANALSYKNAAATSSTNAANSDASATATAAALTNYLATKETLTAPAVDPTLTISGAAADAKTVGNIVTHIDSQIVYKYPLTFTMGYYLNGSGTPVSNAKAGYDETYYPVVPGSKLLTNLNAMGSAKAVLFYDANQVVKSSVNNSGVNTITVPNGSVYARFSCEYANSSDRFVYHATDNPCWKSNSNAVLELDKNVQELLDYDIAIDWDIIGTLYNANGKSVVNSSGGVSSSKYYPVYPGEKLRTNLNANGSARAVLYYNNDFILVTSLELSGSDVTIIVPDGVSYARFSTSYYTDKKYIRHIASKQWTRMSEDEAVLASCQYRYNLDWTTGGYINTSGTISSNADYAYTEDYYTVFPGQELVCRIYAPGPSDTGVTFYDADKSKISHAFVQSTNVTVPANARYARFSNKMTNVPLAEAYVGHNVKEVNNMKCYISDAGVDISSQSLIPYIAKENIIDWKYKGNVNRRKRYLSIGFDDLRDSDLNMIMPLFEKYRGKATFNKVFQTSDANQTDIVRIKRVELGNHELGDHTFFHYAFPYFDPLFNGQDPADPDGTQVPFPSNNDFRNDAGDGKNVFGKTLTSDVDIGGISGVTWADLTDAQCQTIREYYSLIKNTNIITVLDSLSNKYLGTSGSSAGSWDNDTGKYTGGIFTGCETSANHEVWERILACMQCLNKCELMHNMNFITWSQPGSRQSNLSVTYDGVSYYDPNHNYIDSPQTRFTSSLTGKSRSWTDTLRAYGYRVTHDYPRDSRRYSYWQLYFNAWQSKKDALAYPTTYVVSFSTLRNEYPETFFSGTKSKASQMYDVSGSFRSCINALRRNTARGVIHGEMIDSYDTYSEKTFFEALLQYCESAGIEVITHAEGYDIAFNNALDDGNLIGNPELVNTASLFMPDADYVETNPDGYEGSCSVATDDDGLPVLVTAGKTTYILCGVPYGKIKFSADIKGSGTVKFVALKNNDDRTVSVDSLPLLDTITVDSSSVFTEYEKTMIIPKAPLTEYDVKYEGYGNRVMGLGIVYSAGLNVKNIGVYKV